MPDIVAVTKRTVEIVAEHFTRLVEDLQQSAEGDRSAPQRDKRAAFEQAQAASLDAYPASRAAFDEQFGPEEWRRQSALQQRREPMIGGG